MSKKTKKYIKIAITVILLAVAGVCFFRVGGYLDDTAKAAKTDKEMKTILHGNAEGVVEAERITDDEGGSWEYVPFVFTHDTWNNFYAVNHDFVGYLLFPYEFISQPIVQGSDNEFYLYHNVYGYPSDYGTVYMEMDNTVDDQNITLFGHNVFIPYTSFMFTPLIRLTNQNVFNTYHNFDIYYEDHVRHYEITNIFRYDEYADEDFYYIFTQFYEDEEYENYVSWINSHNLIYSDYSLERDDKFVTLQTCENLEATKKIVVIAKEVGRDDY